MVVMAGCVSPKAISALKVGQSANRGHMADSSLPESSRLIAQDNYDLCGEVLYALDGTGMPEDTKKRYAAREAAKAKKDGGK